MSILFLTVEVRMCVTRIVVIALCMYPTFDKNYHNITLPINQVVNIIILKFYAVVNNCILPLVNKQS